jgi:hypothetical protein
MCHNKLKLICSLIVLFCFLLLFLLTEHPSYPHAFMGCPNPGPGRGKTLVAVAGSLGFSSVLIPTLLLLIVNPKGPIEAHLR